MVRGFFTDLQQEGERNPRILPEQGRVLSRYPLRRPNESSFRGNQGITRFGLPHEVIE